MGKRHLISIQQFVLLHFILFFSLNPFLNPIHFARDCFPSQSRHFHAHSRPSFFCWALASPARPTITLSTLSCHSPFWAKLNEGKEPRWAQLWFRPLWGKDCMCCVPKWELVAPAAGGGQNRLFFGDNGKGSGHSHGFGFWLRTQGGQLCGDDGNYVTGLAICELALDSSPIKSKFQSIKGCATC